MQLKFVIPTIRVGIGDDGKTESLLHNPGLAGGWVEVTAVMVVTWWRSVVVTKL